MSTYGSQRIALCIIMGIFTVAHFVFLALGDYIGFPATTVERWRLIGITLGPLAGVGFAALVTGDKNRMVSRSIKVESRMMLLVLLALGLYMLATVGAFLVFWQANPDGSPFQKVASGMSFSELETISAYTTGLTVAVVAGAVNKLFLKEQ